MSLQSNLEQIRTLAAGISQGLGLMLVDARFCQRGSSHCLEITVHRPGGQISLEDCEKVSRQLEELLDQQAVPLVNGSYLLEVQSPGINRELKNKNEFHFFTGQMVEVKSREGIGELGCFFQGQLLGTTEQHLMIGSPQPIDQDKPCGRSAKKLKVSQQDTIAQVEVELSNIISVHLHMLT